MLITVMIEVKIIRKKVDKKKIKKHSNNTLGEI